MAHPEIAADFLNMVFFPRLNELWSKTPVIFGLKIDKKSSPTQKTVPQTLPCRDFSFLNLKTIAGVRHIFKVILIFSEYLLCSPFYYWKRAFSRRFAMVFHPDINRKVIKKKSRFSTINRRFVGTHQETPVFSGTIGVPYRKSVFLREYILKELPV